MVSEEVYFWRIQWAGRWMLTTRRFTERDIRREHPEAIRVDESHQTVFTPETQQERMRASTEAAHSSPDVRYNL
jgi:hypothetical protein